MTNNFQKENFKIENINDINDIIDLTTLSKLDKININDIYIGNSSYPIEIISINDSNNTITFKSHSTTGKKNNIKKTISISEFIKNMSNNYYFDSECSSCKQKQNNKENLFKYCPICKITLCPKCSEAHLENKKEHENYIINNNEKSIKCFIHQNQENTAFCFDCNTHLCGKCLATGKHTRHRKNMVLEVQPTQTLIEKHNEIISIYSERLNDLNKTINEKKNLLINKLKTENEKKIEDIQMKLTLIKKEMTINKKKLMNELYLLKLKYKNEEKLIKEKYSLIFNKIQDKYNNIEINFKNYKNGLLKTLKLKYYNEFQIPEYEKKINKINYLLSINQIIKATQEKYTNNYFNNTNINNILYSYIKSQDSKIRELFNNQSLKEEISNKMSYKGKEINNTNTNANNNEICNESSNNESKKLIKNGLKIVNQTKKKICRIKINNQDKGFGFLCKIPDPVLISNSHILNNETLKEEIVLLFNNEKIIKKIKIDKNRKILSENKSNNRNVDVAILEINVKDDDMQNLEFMEIDDEIIKENQIYEQYLNKEVYVIGRTFKKCILEENNKNDNIYNIKFNPETGENFDGCPILLNNLKVIGICKENIQEGEKYKIGNLLSYFITEYNKIKLKKVEDVHYKNCKNETENKNEKLIKEEKFIKLNENNIPNINEKNGENNTEILSNGVKKDNKEENMDIERKTPPKKEEISPENKNEDKKGINIWSQIKIVLTIEEKDINKKIYFLDNTDADDFYENGKDDISHHHDNLSEMTKENTKLYIQNMETPFEKFFIPHEKGNYEIKLLLTENIKNCNYMFYNCKNITEIDLSSFNSENIKNIFCMFYECENLTKINLESFRTQNVEDMRELFCACVSLTHINLSSFDTKNVLDMSEMFYQCKKLTSINLSKFNTIKVKDMSFMFSGCENLTEINLSNFDTVNLKTTEGMFSECKNLSNIVITSFNSKKLKNISEMFKECQNITEIDLSSFNAEKLKDFDLFLKGCSKLTKIKLNKNLYDKIKEQIPNNINIIYV